MERYAIYFLTFPCISLDFVASFCIPLHFQNISFMKCDEMQGNAKTHKEMYGIVKTCKEIRRNAKKYMGM